LVDDGAIDDPAFNGICRAAEAIAVPILYSRGELFRGREHPPDILEMLGARN
jgi:hypothetical protein